MKTDVVIIGGGVIGLTLAYELSTRGRSVTVVERDRLSSAVRAASSWAASGILPPANLGQATDPIERLRGFSHQLYPQLVDQLVAQTGIDPGLRRCGGWYLSDTIGETASLVGMVQYWRDLSIECEEVDVNEFARREPAMKAWIQASPQARSWWAPDEYQICTPLLLQALIAACKKNGVTILDHSRVVDLEPSGDGANVDVERGAGADRPDQSATPSLPQAIMLTASQAVVCGGTWSGLIAARFDLAQSLVPVRGQILLLKTETPILSAVMNLGQRYLVPRSDGAVLVGSCEEEVGFQHGTTPAALTDLRQFAYEFCPPLKSARELAAWSGLRPLTFDGFPMLGKVPGCDSVFVAAGHFRSGIHLAPATARCMADLMDGQTPPVAIDAFGVGKQQHHTQQNDR